MFLGSGSGTFTARIAWIAGLRGCTYRFTQYEVIQVGIITSMLLLRVPIIIGLV